MPLFEYECRDCGHHFEYLTRAGQAPTCPSCTGEHLQKLLSVFAVNAGSANSTAAAPEGVAPCGMCGDPRGPGSCSMN
jgi:putative FmdB family regulatory protein